MGRRIAAMKARSKAASAAAAVHGDEFFENLWGIGRDGKEDGNLAVGNFCVGLRAKSSKKSQDSANIVEHAKPPHFQGNVNCLRSIGG